MNESDAYEPGDLRRVISVDGSRRPSALYVSLSVRGDHVDLLCAYHQFSVKVLTFEFSVVVRMRELVARHDAS